MASAKAFKSSGQAIQVRFREIHGTSFARPSREPNGSWRILVKTKIQSLSYIATLAVVFGLISWGSAFAQTTPSTPPDQATPQSQQAPTPDTPPSQQTPQTQPTPSTDTPPAAQQPPSSQAPDQAQTPNSQNNAPAPGAADNGTAAASSDSQSFSGTVVKSGDKYMLKDDSGKTYDIDHQSDVAKFEGKRVRVKGTLDSTGTKIMVK
jgi:outer membrane biosynthesis protein TonB